jgi:hypothetical protein
MGANTLVQLADHVNGTSVLGGSTFRLCRSWLSGVSRLYRLAARHCARHLAPHFGERQQGSRFSSLRFAASPTLRKFRAEQLGL